MTGMGCTSTQSTTKNLDQLKIVSLATILQAFNKVPGNA